MPASRDRRAPRWPAQHFDLVSHWRVQAPVERVWAALCDPAGWPQWWPCVQQVKTLREGGPDGLGSVRRIDWTTRLARRIVIEIEAIETLPHQRLRGRSRGSLHGEGLWLLRADETRTDVTCFWRVRLVKRWMRWTAPLLAPLVRWNLYRVMRAGEAGLNRFLADARPLR